MCDNEENKRIYFLDNLFDCRPPYKQNHLKEKTIIMIYKFQNYCSEKNFHLLKI